jgi:hypothetical protein
MHHLAIGKPAFEEKWIIGSYFQVFSMVHSTVAHARLYASAIGDFSPDGIAIRKDGSAVRVYDLSSYHSIGSIYAPHVTSQGAALGTHPSPSRT